MKITTVINAQNLNSTANAGRKASPKPANSNVNAPADFNRRFDTFTMTGTEKTQKANKSKNTPKTIDAAKQELIRNLSEYSDEDKANIAFGSFIEMKISLINAKGYVENQVSSFTELKDQQKYYTELAKNGGYIGDEGKYAFSKSKEGDFAAISDISKELDNVQRRLDILCGKVEGTGSEANYLMGENSVLAFFHKMNEKFFAAEAATFSAVTGIEDSALEINPGDFDFDKTDVTEENFLEKANAVIESIEARDKAVTDMWTQYAYDNLFTRHVNPTKALDWLKSLEGTQLGHMLSDFHRLVVENFGKEE